MKKKLISICLVLCIILSAFPVAAFAGESTQLEVTFNTVYINQAYVNWARVTGAQVISAQTLEAVPEEDEDGRVHIQVEVSRNTGDGDVIQVEMNVSEQNSGGITSRLSATKSGAGVGAEDDLYYEIPIENGTGRMTCYSYYDSTKFTTFVIDFVVGDEEGEYKDPRSCNTNDAVMTQIRVWDQPVLKSMFRNIGAVEVPNSGNHSYKGLVGYLWLEESVSDDAVLGIELGIGNSVTENLPADWTRKGGYVQLENGEAVVQFLLYSRAPMPLGQNRQVTIYIKNHLSYVPELNAGVSAEVELQTEVGVPYIVDFRDYFTDRDDDTLTYLVSVDGADAVEQTSYKYRYNPSQTGVRTLKVQAYDGEMLSEACTIKLTAKEEHVWGEWTVTKSATCNKAGVREHTCICCGTQETESVAASGTHTWDKWIITKRANCIETGEQMRTCTACGAIEKESIPAGEHDWVVTTTATCGQAGTETAQCAGCKETKTAPAEATGKHSWGQWEVTTPATCGEAGVETRSCRVCSQNETQEIPATGIHPWGAWQETIAPSCVDGLRERFCSECTESQSVAIPKNGEHIWGEWIETKAPTATEDGEEKRQCENCDESMTRVVYYTEPCAYVNISIAGDFKLIMAEVPLEDCDGKEGITVNDILLKTHILYAPNGAQSYQTYQTWITKMWEDESGAVGYLKNQTFCWDINETVESGDVIDAYVYQDLFDFKDLFSYFDQREVNVDARTPFELTLYHLQPYGSEYKVVPVSGAQILINGETTDYTTDSEGKVTITIEKGGSYEILAKCNSVVTVPAACLVEVDSNQIKLYPPVLTQALATGTSIAVTPPEASYQDGDAVIEYAICTEGGTWSKWQTSPEFKKLENSTEYLIRARYVASDTDKYLTSDSSEILQVTTAAGPSAIYTFGDVSAAPGQIIQIPVRILCETEDIGKWNAALEFDASLFTLVGIEPGADAGDWSVKVNRVTHCVYGTLPEGKGADGINGELFLLKLKVKENAQPGDYTVTLSDVWNRADENAFWNSDGIYLKVSGQVKAACVTVAQETAEPDFVQDSEPAESFMDVSDEAWYYEDVQYVAQEKLMNGTSVTDFSPEEQTNRAMMVTVLYRMEGSPAVDGVAPFADVPQDSYYSDAVIWAYENGIIKGVCADAFAPDQPISRQQVATILHRYAQYHNVDVSAAGAVEGFADSEQISAYARGAMDWAVGSGLLQGYAGKLEPNGNATRAQLAAILSRYFS